jgi:ribose transport system substrate-binding protein
MTTHDGGMAAATRRDTAMARRGRTLCAFLAILGGVLAFAGCGGDDDEPEAQAGGAQSQGEYRERLQELYDGTYREPTANAPKPESGKKVWIVSAGQNIEAAEEATAVAKEAAKKLGWELTVFDGRYDPSRQLAGVEQALAAGADGIVALYLGCAPLRAGLQRANQAKVPTVAIEGIDCDPPLFTHHVNYAGGMSFREWIKGWGAAMAAWVIGKTDGKAKAIVVEQTDIDFGKLTADGWREEFAKCPTCEIVQSVKFTGPEFGPQLQAKIEQALLQHPEANSLIPAYDTVLTSGGGGNALVASGRLDEMKVAGGEGGSSGIEQIYEGTGMQSCSGVPPSWETLGALDALVRLFAGEDPAKTQTGIGWQVCDKDHNLPPKGEMYQPPIDYKAAYYRSWGVE